MIHTAKCVICDFPLYDFIIKKEYKFIRNIYNSDVWNKSNDIRKLHNFYEAFKFFVRVAFILCDVYDEETNVELINHELKNFLMTIIQMLIYFLKFWKRYMIST